jgi:hypothetical protein
MPLTYTSPTPLYLSCTPDPNFHYNLPTLTLLLTFGTFQLYFPLP